MNEPNTELAHELDKRAAARAVGLERAVAKRKEMAGLKKLLRDKKVDAISLIAGDVEWAEPTVQGFRIDQLLKAIPYIGPVRTFEILQVFRASPNVKIKNLSTDRRRELAALVRQSLEFGAPLSRPQV